MTILRERQVAQLAKAKVNLALHVTGRRVDGYHLLDSLVVFADIGDRLIVSKADKTSLEFSGPFGQALTGGDDNLVLQAFRKLSAALPAPLPATAFHLVKNLPVSSGIGGGSADAAAVLNGLIKLWQVEIDARALAQIALDLGADVPVCLTSQNCRMTGIGELVKSVDDFPGIDCVLVNPGIGVATPDVFNRLKLPVDQKAFDGLPDLPTGDWVNWLAETRNDLQSPAIAVAPEIAETIAGLEQSSSCSLARMSGSGATCFGLYGNGDDARQAAQQISRDHPDWWVVATKLG